MPSLRRASMLLVILATFSTAIGFAADTAPASAPASLGDPNTPLNIAVYTPPIRVACLGDSITHGVGADPGWAWPDQLDRMLGAQWDVRNFGHSGAAVSKGEKNAIWGVKEYKMALEYHPDVVIILLGTNDSKPQNWANKEEFPKLYRELVVSFLKLSSKPRVFCATPPYVAKKGAFGINEPVVLEEIPIIRQIAADAAAGYIDVHAATNGHDEWYGDNVHPHVPGATAIAKAVYKSLTGTDWAGAVPAPSVDAKSRPMPRSVENPGELSFKECYTLIATEAGIVPEKLLPLRQYYDNRSAEVDAKLASFESEIAGYDELRMKYKHSKNPDEQKLYGVYRGKIKASAAELAKYKYDVNKELIALIPAENRAGFGAAWVGKYVLDRLTPISADLTSDQRKAIRVVCAKHGGAYGAINNTPERSLASQEVFQEVYDHVLTSQQQRRVER